MKKPVIAKESIQNAPLSMQRKERKAKPHSVDEHTRLEKVNSAVTE